MFRGFNLRMSHSEPTLLKKGSLLREDHQSKIRKALDVFLSVDGKIDGNKLQEAWFPQVNADIFLSHSHNDENKALTLSGWLKQEFDINAFVDSSIWDYAGTLLKAIDNNYCYNKDSNTYFYEKRNLSTAHVHLMLATSLTKMMDNCECLLFVNTPNSLDASSIISDSKTFSPWLYYETGISRLLTKPLAFHDRRRYMEKSLNYSINESMRDAIAYKVDIGHLTEITANNLIEWRNAYRAKIPKPDFALDTLYELFT
jgi:hypothetical protein